MWSVIQVSRQNVLLVHHHVKQGSSNQFFWFPTDTGQLMARYCVAFNTMKNFHEMAGTEDVADLVSNPPLTCVNYMIPVRGL